MWEEADIERLAYVDRLKDDADKAWQFYSALRSAMREAMPNAAHLTLARWEQTLIDAGRAFTLITQNIDGLHKKAGSKNVVEMHGGIFRTRCNNPECPKSTPIDDDDVHTTAPICAACGSLLRPDIVLFGEMIPAEADYQTSAALRMCDLFIAIGTSGTVYPACDFVRSAKLAGARTILINPDTVPAQYAFDEYISGKAEDVLPELLPIV